MPHPLPEPVEDAVNPNASAESELRELLVSQSKAALQFMVDKLGDGWNPVRAMRLIENYSASTRHHISELVAEPLEDDDYEDDVGYGVAPLRVGNIVGGGMFENDGARARRRDRRRRGQGLVHGGPGGGPDLDDIGAQVGGMLEGMAPMLQSLNKRDRTGQIKDLTSAIASARHIEDPVLEEQLRAQLREVMGTTEPRPISPEELKEAQGFQDATYTDVVDAEVVDAEFVEVVDGVQNLPERGDAVLSNVNDGGHRYTVERQAAREQVKISPDEEIEGANARFVKICDLRLAHGTQRERPWMWMEVEAHEKTP